MLWSRAEALFKPFLEYILRRALVFLQWRRANKPSFQHGQPKTEWYPTMPWYTAMNWVVPLPNLNVETLSLTVTIFAAAAAAKSLQSCPTLCDPIDGSPPGSAVPGILQTRTLEWVAISFSNAGKWKVKVKSFSRVWLLATPWTAAHPAPPSMGFSRQEYWSGVPLGTLGRVN